MKKKLLACCALAGILLTGAVLLWWWTIDPLSDAFARITEGMPMEDVTAIMGRAPDEVIARYPMVDGVTTTAIDETTWKGSHRRFAVTSRNGVVVFKEAVSTQSTVMDKVLEWFRGRSNAAKSNGAPSVLNQKRYVWIHRSV